MHEWLIQFSYNISYAVEKKLEHAQQLVGQLKSKSAALNWKVEDAKKDVGYLKCGFGTLKDDVAVLESARSELLAVATDAGTSLEQHVDESASELSDLVNIVEEKKEKVEKVKDFTHPCGGSGWEQVEYLDFRDSGTSCPSAFAQTLYPERPYTCGIKSSASGTCDLLTISVGGREYSKVCGRIRAYQFGTTDGFALYVVFGITISFSYLSGISITHGGTIGDPSDPPTHIWSFVAGLTQFQSTASPGFLRSHCPCGLGPDPPDFVGEDYFCESVIEEDIQPSNVDEFDSTFHFRSVLWDGEGCGDEAECCSRIKHPYFVKQLEASTMDDIDLRLCLSNDITQENIAIELIELYVQ